MMDLGYDSNNMMMNLGTLSVLFFLYYVKVIYLFHIMAINYFKNKKCCIKNIILARINNNLEKQIKKLKEMLFFNELLLLVTEGYLEFGISSYLFIMQPVYTSAGEYISSAIGFAALGISFYLLLLWLLF